jgi:hypothetical protein
MTPQDFPLAIAVDRSRISIWLLEPEEINAVYRIIPNERV